MILVYNWELKSRDKVVSEPLKDCLFFDIFKLQLYKAEIGVVKNIFIKLSWSFNNYR